MNPILKKLGLFFLLIFSIALSVKTNAQTGWKWGVGSIGSVEGFLIATDAASNSFVSGTVKNADSTLFGSVMLFDTGTGSQMVVTKLDSAGHFLWSVGTQRTDATPISIVTDDGGNVYVLGYYDSSKCDIGSFVLTNPYPGFFGYYDMYFIVKISSAGKVLWAQNVAPGNEFGAAEGGIGIDSADKLYLTGDFTFSTITIGSTTLTNTSSGNSDIFIAKYDTLGNFIWAKSFGGPSSDFSVAIAVAKSGDFYIPGQYNTSITAGPFTVIDSGNFVAKFDNNGNANWLKNMRAGLAVADIATDASECVYMAGSINTGIIIGTDTLTDVGSQDLYVTKYDSSGNAVWSRSAGGVHSDRAFSIKTDIYRNVWVCGTMGSGPGLGYTMNFNGHILAEPPGPAADPIFIAEYNNCGSYLRGVSLISGGDDQCSIAVDARDNLYIGGDYTGDTVFVGPDTLAAPVLGEFLLVAKYHYDHTQSIPSFPEMTRTISMCVTSASTSLNSLLAVSYGDTGLVLDWSLIMPPVHGTAVASYSASSTGALLTPTGLTYTPASGYVGADSFKVKVSLCEDSAMVTIFVNIDSFPVAGKITGKDTVCIGHVVTLSDNIPGGTWSNKNPFATVGATGIVTGAATGTDTIYYTVTNACGTKDTSVLMRILPNGECNTEVAGIPFTASNGLMIYPNPNPGSFKFELSADLQEEVHVVVANAIGTIVKQWTARTNQLTEIQFNCPTGIYFLNAATGSGYWSGKITVINK